VRLCWIVVEDASHRIIVGVSGSPGSLQALRRAVAEARLRESVIWSVITWVPQGGEAANRRMPCPELLRLWRDAAAQRLCTAWQEALGGIPDDLDAHLFALRGTPGRRLVLLADREDDLLVVGAGTSGALRRLVRGSVSRYCLSRAQCPVLTVPPTLAQRRLQHHPLARRRIVRDLARHDAGPS